MNQYTQDTGPEKENHIKLLFARIRPKCFAPFLFDWLFFFEIKSESVTYIEDQISWSYSYCGKGESLLWPATWDEGALKGREGDQRSQIWATHYSAIFSFRESFSRTGIQPKQRETSTKSLWLPKRVYFMHNLPCWSLSQVDVNGV